MIGRGFYFTEEELTPDWVKERELRMSEQVARDRNGKEIRVGDRVRLTSNWSYAGLREGEVGVVTDIKNKGSFSVNGHDGCGSEYWEFVSSSADSELEALVKKANEGSDACLILKTKYRDRLDVRKFRVEATTLISDWHSLTQDDSEQFTRTFYQIKKKTFTPLTVGKNWNVSLSDDQKRLTIGCQTFVEQGIKFSQAFKNVVSGEKAMNFFATGLGARHTSTGEIIPWNDVDKIVKALEEVGA